MLASHDAVELSVSEKEWLAALTAKTAWSRQGVD
jgi:hypothetical protein